MSAETPIPGRYGAKPGTCPECGSDRIASLLYGFPRMTPNLQRALAEGRIRLGGCCVSDDDPAWECADCGAPLYPRQDGEQLV